MHARGRLIGLSLVFLLSGALQAAEAQMTVVLVRHAEKATTPAGDPALSPAGLARAKTLAHVAGSTGATAIFVTQFLRTKQTAKPLALALGVTPTEHPAADTPGLVNAIRSAGAGKTVVVCGHSNTVPQIITALTGVHMPDIPDSQFDNLYVVSVPSDGRGVLTHLKYGKQTP